VRSARRLSQASKLLNEKKISLATYREVTWRHMRRAALEARKTAEAQAAAKIGF
jgi:hypothetical protein